MHWTASAVNFGIVRSQRGHRIVGFVVLRVIVAREVVTA